ncbi:MAG: ABC transporter ATP-binding protein [Desulfobacterales bacterium]|nr:ABC transporter ATP-binding protein [Desulfobacterales bacterium]
MADGFILKDVSFRHGAKRAVDSVALRLPAGKLYGLIGPNGCGKTTLLDLLIGNRRPCSGAVIYQGRPLTALRRRQVAREMALVPQDFGINFAFTVLEVVLMGRHPHIPRFGAPTGRDLAIAREAMDAINIRDFADRYVPELSGGEKQRVVVARALAQQTPVLLLDEATSNLDIQHTLDIFRVCQRLVRAGKTVIAVIHNLNLAAAYCDELIFMKQGRISCTGPKAETLNPENIRTVFGVESRVYFDEFCRSQQISFRY